MDIIILSNNIKENCRAGITRRNDVHSYKNNPSQSSLMTH